MPSTAPLISGARSTTTSTKSAVNAASPDTSACASTPSKAAGMTSVRSRSTASRASSVDGSSRLVASTTSRSRRVTGDRDVAVVGVGLDGGDQLPRRPLDRGIGEVVGGHGDRCADQPAVALGVEHPLRLGVNGEAALVGERALEPRRCHAECDGDEHDPGADRDDGMSRRDAREPTGAADAVRAMSFRGARLPRRGAVRTVVASADAPLTWCRRSPLVVWAGRSTGCLTRRGGGDPERRRGRTLPHRSTCTGSRAARSRMGDPRGRLGDLPHGAAGPASARVHRERRRATSATSERGA